MAILEINVLRAKAYLWEHRVLGLCTCRRITGIDFDGVLHDLAPLRNDTWFGLTPHVLLLSGYPPPPRAIHIAHLKRTPLHRPNLNQTRMQPLGSSDLARYVDNLH